MDLRKKILRDDKLAAFEMPEPHRVVATRVQRITLQRFPPIQGGATSRVPILIEVQTSDVKFVGAGDVGGCGWFGGWRRDFANGARLGLIGNDLLAGGISDAQKQIGFLDAAREFNFGDERLIGRKVAHG